MKRYGWVSDFDNGSVLENHNDPDLNSLWTNDVFVIDTKTGIIYTGDIKGGTGTLEDDVETFVEG